MRIPILLCLLLARAVLSAAPGGASTQASLILAASEARPGDTIQAGVRLKMKKGWHTYWRNPGESGTATTVQWQLPPGITAGPLAWPVPEKLLTSPITTYVLHGEAILLTTLTLAKDLKPGPLELKADVAWLECEDLCLPGDATVSATLTIGAETKPSASVDALQAARKQLPGNSPANTPPVRWADADSATERALEIRSTPPAGMSADFYPYANDDYEVTAAMTAVPGGFQKRVKKSGATWPVAIPGLLVTLDGEHVSSAVEAVLQPATGEASGPGASPVPPSRPGSQSLVVMLAFAFLGGLILNVMPCVLPVIALKVLGFVNQSRETPERVRLLGIAYGVGVITCFVGLAAAAIVVRQAGGLASWGMLLQNQVARVLLTVVITLVALNLFGVFEVVLSGRISESAGDLAAREGLSGAFFNGLLAAVLATPCTAPFMGTALAFAFTQPPLTTILVFVSLGLGLAAPFVLLCWQPGWLKLLPRPGVWMERFKVAMGFPMLATAVWLFWFTAPRFGRDGVLYLGLFLVVLAAASWTFGEFVQRGRKRRGLAGAIAILMLLAGHVYLLEGQLHWRRPISPASRDSGSLRNGTDGIDWQAWSPEAVATARAAGHPVLVDFTADNCLNCKLNKITSLEIDATRARLREGNVVAFLADFTDRDPRIAAVLQTHERAGVPLVLVYPADPTKPPEVLPPVLTPAIVHAALERAARAGK